MVHLTEFIVASFACYRLATLVAIDNGPSDIFLRLRTKAGCCAAAEQGRGKEQGPCISLAALLNCPYCLGLWFAPVLALLIAGSVQEYILLSLGIAGVQTFLQEITNDGS